MVFVTKYRRKIITPEMEADLRIAFENILKGWGCELVEVGIEPDHAHLLIDIKPSVEIAKLANNLKSATSRRIRNKYATYIDQFYWKPFFWHRAYFVSSVGNASLETVKAYIAKQTTDSKFCRTPFST